MKKVFSVLLVFLLVFSLSAKENNFAAGVSFETLGMVKSGLNIYEYSDTPTPSPINTPFVDSGINLSVAYKTSEAWQIYGKVGLDYVAAKLISLNGPEFVFSKGLPLWVGFGADKYVKTVNILEVPFDIRGGFDVSYYDWMPGESIGPGQNDNVGQILDLSATLSANHKDVFSKLSVGYRSFFGETYKISKFPVSVKLSVGIMKDL